MKLPKKHSKKTFYGVCILLVSVAIAVFLILPTLFKHDSLVTPINYGPPTSDQTKAGSQIKGTSVNLGDASKPNVSGSDQAKSPSPQPNGKASVDATLTSANQNGSLLYLRFDISTIVTNNGTCTLILTKGSSTITKTASVQAVVGSSTCKGFDIPTNELSAGIWKIAMHFENNSFEGDAVGSAVVQ